jgi:hypothetical protein
MAGAFRSCAPTSCDPTPDAAPRRPSDGDSDLISRQGTRSERAMGSSPAPMPARIQYWWSCLSSAAADPEQRSV